MHCITLLIMSLYVLGFIQSQEWVDLFCLLKILSCRAIDKTYSYKWFLFYAATTPIDIRTADGLQSMSLPSGTAFLMCLPCQHCKPKCCKHKIQSCKSDVNGALTAMSKRTSSRFSVPELLLLDGFLATIMLNVPLATSDVNVNICIGSFRYSRKQKTNQNNLGYALPILKSDFSRSRFGLLD